MTILPAENTRQRRDELFRLVHNKVKGLSVVFCERKKRYKSAFKEKRLKREKRERKERTGLAK
jgi:hypothetical protein